LLNVFGGKLTTYRKLAEAALTKMRPYFPALGQAWTTTAALPGGDFPVDGAEILAAKLQEAYPFLSEAHRDRLVTGYGTEAFHLLGDSRSTADLGCLFGWNLYAREVQWLVDHEYARTADDIVWRRSKLGLRLTPTEIQALECWIQDAREGRLAQAS